MTLLRRLAGLLLLLLLLLLLRLPPGLALYEEVNAPPPPSALPLLETTPSPRCETKPAERQIRSKLGDDDGEELLLGDPSSPSSSVTTIPAAGDMVLLRKGYYYFFLLLISCTVLRFATCNYSYITSSLFYRQFSLKKIKNGKAAVALFLLPLGLAATCMYATN
jgi:hypothetical protein